MNTRKECSFEEADEEAVCHKLGIPLSSVLQQRKYSPAYLEPWNDVVHLEHGKEYHEGNLSNDRADHIHGLEIDELVAIEVEIFFEACNVCVICRRL